MKALFLGNVAADTYNGIRDELPPGLDCIVVADPNDLRARRRPPMPTFSSAITGAPSIRRRPISGWCSRSRPGSICSIWRALPKGAAICNAFGHETAIAEYVVMTWLALHHRLFQISGEFRERGSWRTSWVESGAPHGEVRGSTLGIVGYGRVGREVARRAAPFGARILAANRTPRDPDPGVERVYPLAELDRMLPECDTVALCTALGPETTGLIDARRLALMKPSAFLINIARGQVIDEDALYAALRDGRLGGAALDVWWQYPTDAEPQPPRLAPPVPRTAQRHRDAAQFRLDQRHGAAPLGRGRRQHPPLRARRDADQRRHDDLRTGHMKTLFLGGLAARVAPRILGKMREKLDDPAILAELNDMQRLIPALAEAEIVVGHIWRPDFPEAPRLKLLQAATAGIDMIDVPSLPRGITVCNVYGHEPAIAEYVMMTMLALTHRLFDTVTAFRAGSWAAHQPAGGVAAWRDLRQDDRHRRLWPDRPRGGAARGAVRLQGHRRQPQPGRRQGRRLGNLSARRARPHAAAMRRGAGRRRSRRRKRAGLIDARRLALMKPTRAADQYRPRRDRRRGGALRGAAR